MSVQFPILFSVLLFCLTYCSPNKFAVPFNEFSRKPLITHLVYSADKCGEESFFCELSNRCIPIDWRCDNEQDCLENEDEKNCDAHCTNQEYMCEEPSEEDKKNAFLMTLSKPLYNNKQHCIPKQWLCDGEADCIKHDDERNCQKVTCVSTTHFECRGFDNIATTCIPLHWVCDGQTDCFDRSDEANCTFSSPTVNVPITNGTLPLNDCTADGEFRCHSGMCISKNWVCDGEPDCNDQSDELECRNTDQCAKLDKFKCTTGPCIPKLWQCDGEQDCPDNSDEKNCKYDNLQSTVNCTERQFKCSTHTHCIDKNYVCDGDNDCVDGSDEENCQKNHCPYNSQLCADGNGCVDSHEICDGKKQCADGSDEENCSNNLIKTECDKTSEYTCTTSPLKCIKYDELCKANNTDCIKSVCNSKILLCKSDDPGCTCRNMRPNGHLCYCKEGFELIDGHCQDIDECKHIGTCDQICHNFVGGYRCDCHLGFALTAGYDTSRVPHKCRALGEDPQLLLSNRATIRQYDLTTNKYMPLISSLESAVALDYWHANKTLIWSDVSKEQIMICHLGDKSMLSNVSECVEQGNVTLLTENINTPDGLAIDWVHGLLFWTDTGLDKISVYDLKKRRRRVLFDNGLDEPRAIAVDPTTGLIFWTDWGAKPRIERAGMDGNNRVEIVSGDIVVWPNGLALDILDQRVYWADAKLKTISSCDYWGKDIRTVLHSHDYLRHPFSLAVFEEKLYYTDWDHEGVISVNKFNGKDAKPLMKGVTGPMTVRVYHSQAQPNRSDKCINNICEHLCLPRAHFSEALREQEIGLQGGVYSCACENGFKLSYELPGACVAEGLLGVVPGDISTNKVQILYFGLMFAVIVVLVLVFAQYRQRPTHFAVLHFDNPIYRRTVENLDAEMENPPDNSLGAISTLPVGNVAWSSKDETKLVLNGHTNESAEKTNGGFSHSNQQPLNSQYLMSSSDTNPLV